MRKHPWSGNKADCRLGIPVVPQSPNMGEPFSREQRVWKKLWKSLWKSCWQVTAYFPLPEQARSNVPFPYTNRYTSGFSISLIFSFSISYPDTYPFPITLIVTKKQLITSEKSVCAIFTPAVPSPPGACPEAPKAPGLPGWISLPARPGTAWR